MQTLDLRASSPQNVIAAATKVLAEGGLIIFPTETVYGAGVDATNPAAVKKLLAYKSRREGKPLSIAVTEKEMAAQYVEVNDQAERLYDQFLPGPLTVVSKGKGVVAPGVESEFGSLGVRIPNHPWLLQLITAFGKPITATSANASGEKRPYTIKDIFDRLSTKQKSLVDLVIDAGTLPPNPPSTVIDTTLSTPTTLREGEMAADPLFLQLVPDSSMLISQSELETKTIAGRLILQYWDEIRDKGVVIGLSGELGAGKTIFTKGIAEFLQITTTITSPTYTYHEEYAYHRHGVAGKLHHLDLWKVDSSAEAERLALAALIEPKAIVVVEWWTQVQDYLLRTLNSYPSNRAPLFIAVTFAEKDILTREITIYKP